MVSEYERVHDLQQSRGDVLEDSYSDDHWSEGELGEIVTTDRTSAAVALQTRGRGVMGKKAAAKRRTEAMRMDDRRWHASVQVQVRCTTLWL